MKTLNIVSAAVFTAAALFAGVASADTSRDQVIAELAQARANGSLAAMNSEDSANFLQGKTAAVTAAAKISAPVQQVAQSQDTGMFVGSENNKASAKTRAQVIAELKQSRASGELALLQSEDQADAQQRLAVLRTKNAAVMAE